MNSPLTVSATSALAEVMASRERHSAGRSTFRKDTPVPFVAMFEVSSRRRAEHVPCLAARDSGERGGSCARRFTGAARRPYARGGGESLAAAAARADAIRAAAAAGI